MNRVITHFEYTLNCSSENEKKLFIKQHDIVKLWICGTELIEIVGRVSQITEEAIVIDSSSLYHKSETRITTNQIFDMEVLPNDNIRKTT